MKIPFSRTARLYFRKYTAKDKRRPRFLIAGAPRCGTTSLYKYLAQHSQINVPTAKEIHYFDKWYGKGAGFYRSFFPYSGITYEATAAYLSNENAIQRIHSFDPDMKLIILLREPLARAISHYRHFLDSGIVITEKELLRYSRYELGLPVIFKYFKDEQLFICQSEYFYANTEKVLDQVFDFIGVEKETVNTARKHGESYNRVNPPYELGDFAETKEYVREKLGFEWK